MLLCGWGRQIPISVDKPWPRDKEAQLAWVLSLWTTQAPEVPCSLCGLNRSLGRWAACGQHSNHLYHWTSPENLETFVCTKNFRTTQNLKDHDPECEVINSRAHSFWCIWLLSKPCLQSPGGERKGLLSIFLFFFRLHMFGPRGDICYLDLPSPLEVVSCSLCFGFFQGKWATFLLWLSV